MQIRKTARTQLPPDYREIFSVDLMKNKRQIYLVNGLAILITLAMAIPMHFYIPVTSLFGMDDLWELWRLGALVVLSIGYIMLHELVHGMTMKLCGTKKVKYGYKVVYACAGSDDYYPKGSYILIALAPVVLWGVVIGIINCFVSVTWFWVVYILQITNLSGAAGDLYVTFRFLKLPGDILIRDSGTTMKVYSHTEVSSKNVS